MAASVVVEMTGREARLWQAQQRIIEQQLKIEQKYRQVGTEATLAGNKAQTAGQKSSQAFGAGAVSQLQSYASMFAGVAGAIGLVTKAFAEMAQAREQAAQASEASYLGLGSLAQLAKTPEEMREYLAASREAYSKGAGRNQFEAGELVFSLISAGAYEARDLFTELRASGTVADPATLITAAKTMRASMGEQETGDWRAIVSKGFGASAHSPARVEALLQAASRSGTSASAMGMSDEEVMAATALLATAKGTAETGGTYLAQMFRTLKQKGRFKGKTLEDTILEVKAEQMTPEEKAEFFELSPVLARESKRWFKENKGQGLSPQEQELAWAKEMKLEGTTEEERKQWFGRAQGQEAFDIVAANLGEYKKILADVEAAQREDRVKDHLRAAAADPSLRAQRIRNQSKASEELSREELGIMKNLGDTVMDQYAVAVREGREKTWLPPEWAIAITKVINNTNRNLEGDQSWLQRNQDEFRGIRRRSHPAGDQGAGGRRIAEDRLERPGGEADQGRLPGDATGGGHAGGPVGRRRLAEQWHPARTQGESPVPATSRGAVRSARGCPTARGGHACSTAAAPTPDPGGRSSAGRDHPIRSLSAGGPHCIAARAGKRGSPAKDSGGRSERSGRAIDGGRRSTV